MRTREKKLTTTVHRYVEADDKNSDAHYKNSNGQNFPAEHQNSTAEHQGRLRLLLLVLHHQFIGQILVTAAVHVGHSLTNELICIGIIEER